MIKYREKDITIIFFLLILLPYYKPGFFDDIPILDIFFNFIRLFNSFIVILFFINYKKYDKAFFILLLLEICFFVSTMINHASLYYFIKEKYLQLIIYMIFSICIMWPRETIRYLLAVGELLTYMNLLSIILYPDGLYKNITNNWFLGYKNYYIPFYWTSLVAAFLYKKYENKNSKRPVVLVMAMALSLYLANSSTSIMMIVLFCGMAIILGKRDYKIVNSVTFYIVNIILFYLVVIKRAVEYFSFIIIRLLHKNTMLSGRIRIWDQVQELIKDKPLFGYGCISIEESRILTSLSFGTHAHDTILQYIYTGGFIALFFFIWFNIIIMKKLYDFKNSYSSKIISIAIFVYYIGCLTETYSNGLTFGLFAFANSIEYLVAYEKEQNHDDSIRKFPIIIKLRNRPTFDTNQFNRKSRL